MIARHYEQLLGLTRPWRVSEIDTDHQAREVRIHLEHGGGRRLRCPECGRVASGYDTRQRRWRHLDTMAYRTVLVAEVPRVGCPEHGVRQIEVRWVEAGSRLTALFKALAIDWLCEASVSAVARLLLLSWDQVAGTQARAVARGLARRQAQAPTRIGVDETAFRRGHDYVMVVTDLASGRSPRGPRAAFR